MFLLCGLAGGVTVLDGSMGSDLAVWGAVFDGRLGCYEFTMGVGSF